MQILDAMAVLRDSRIIHCDLKPENVLLKNVESGAQSAEGGAAGPQRRRRSSTRRQPCTRPPSLLYCLSFLAL